MKSEEVQKISLKDKKKKKKKAAWEAQTTALWGIYIVGFTSIQRSFLYITAVFSMANAKLKDQQHHKHST